MIGVKNQLQAQTEYCNNDSSSFRAKPVLPSPSYTWSEQLFPPIVAGASRSDTSRLTAQAKRKLPPPPKKGGREKRKDVREEEGRLREHFSHPKASIKSAFQSGGEGTSRI